MTLYFARTKLASGFTADQLAVWLSEAGDRVEDVYYPVDPCEPHSFSTVYPAMKSLSLDFVERWCSIPGTIKQPPAIDARSRFFVEKFSERLPSFLNMVNECVELSLFFSCRVMSKTATTHLTFDNHRDRRAAFSVSVRPPNDLTLDHREAVGDFWRIWLEHLSVFGSSQLVENDQKGAPSIRVMDDTLHEYLNPTRNRPRGIWLNSTKENWLKSIEQTTLLALQDECLQCDWVSLVCSLPKVDLNRRMSLLHEVSEVWDYSFNGCYHIDFSLEQLENYPAEGFWYLPLFCLSCDNPNREAEHYFVKVYLLKTPDQEFLEFFAYDDGAIEVATEGLSFAADLEFWRGEAHRRWGLSRE